MKEIEETIDLDSETDKPAAKKSKRNEGSAFEGTLLGGSSRKDETGSSAATTEEHKPSDELKEAATSKPCSACTYNNPLTNAQCEICDTPLPQVP